MRSEILKRMKEDKVIAIVRGVPFDCMEQTIRALLKGGVCLAEITYNHSSEEGRKETLECLELVRQKLGERVLLGAGTVLTERDVEDAKEAGADYVISPNVNEKVIRRTRELNMVSMPGAFTPTEVVTAYEAGADIVKLFPAALMGLSYINALRGPLGHIPVSAVGGVTPETVPEFLAAGVSCFGIGGNLVDLEKIRAGAFEEIEERARQFHRAATGM